MSERRWLLLETSGRQGLVGLGRDTTVIAERRLDADRRHAQDLMPAVAELLGHAQWQPRDIHAVAVSLGPGSYTGLRVGVMAAKAFAYAVGCQLIAVPTFEIIARQTTLKCLALEVISDALKDKLYAQRFRRDELDQSWIADEPLAVVRREKWLSALRPGSGVTGPGVEVVRSDVPGALMVAPSAERAPALPELLATASARFGTTRPGSISALEPIYLRPSSAEEQWDTRTGSV